MLIINAHEGQAIRIGDRLIRVRSVTAPGHVLVDVEGEDDPVTVSWDRKLDIFPQVLVTVERQLGMAQRVKFLFQAPRSVMIRELPFDTSI